MPSFEAMVSDTTEPIKASVIATFNDANRYGSERGMPTLVRTSYRDAPSTRSTSFISGSTLASPAATLTTIGKNEITKAVMIAGTVPIPDQITIRGTTATFGIELNPINSG